MDRDGLITIQSRYTPKETMQRLETAVKSKGMTVFAHIDHAAGGAVGGQAEAEHQQAEPRAQGLSLPPAQQGD